MQRFKSFLSIIAAMSLVFLASVGLAAPAQASGAQQYNYVCVDNSGQSQDWDGLDPYTCVGFMDVYNSAGTKIVHVKDGANSSQVVDCTFGHPDEIINIYTPSETIGWGLAEFIWEDSWIVGYNCLAT